MTTVVSQAAPTNHPRVRDHLSALMITVIYGIFAASTILILLVVQPIAARIVRRGVMISAVVTMMVAAGVLAARKALPGLLIGRLLTGPQADSHPEWRSRIYSSFACALTPRPRSVEPAPSARRSMSAHWGSALCSPACSRSGAGCS
jgi:MFS family permease